MMRVVRRHRWHEGGGNTLLPLLLVMELLLLLLLDMELLLMDVGVEVVWGGWRHGRLWRLKHR